MQDIELQVSQQGRELKLSVQEEAKERQTADDNLKALLRELSGGLDTEASCRADVARDAERGVRELFEIIQEASERLSRLEESTTHGVSDDGLKASRAVESRVMSLGERVEKESRDRQAFAEEVRRKLQNLASASQRDLKPNDGGAAMAHVQALEATMVQKFENLQQSLEMEVAVRQASGEQLEAKCTNLPAKLRNELDQAAGDLRSALKIEAALREAGDEAGKALAAKVKLLERTIVDGRHLMHIASSDTEGDHQLAVQVHQCRMDVRGVRESLAAETRAFQQSIGEEVEMRKAADDRHDELAARLRAGLELEGKERLVSVRKVEDEVKACERAADASLAKSIDGVYVRMEEIAASLREEGAEVRHGWERSVAHVREALNTHTHDVRMHEEHVGSAVICPPLTIQSRIRPRLTSPTRYPSPR
eukprot:NODE_9582_length_1413_cov_5.336703.p1 GENE.NODE_9582_length_1413_cov_5.336703~~NODE_9582_length_1413_cov_5.336703.p1  ORF type:complete len:423 (-),score=147.21 NODE_9582_length_1413_cov_5.336703:145-1413(-)